MREDLHRGPREWVCAHPQPVQRIQPDSLEEIDVSIVPVGKPCPKCHAEYGDSLELANMRRAFAKCRNAGGVRWDATGSPSTR